MFTGRIFPIKSYQSLYLKSGPIKAYMGEYFNSAFIHVMRCMSPAPQNGFRERKVYHNFVQFCTPSPKFCTPYPLALSAIQIWGAGDMQPPKCSFNIKNWIIILYSFCTILYIESQILYPIPSCAIGNYNLVVCMSPDRPNAVSTEKTGS